MTKKHREQIRFILEVTKRYKENGGYIYRFHDNGKVRVRVSLADFILFELGALEQ